MVGDETVGGHNGGGGSETAPRYDKGGWLSSGSVGVNTLSKPERILAPAESGDEP